MPAFDPNAGLVDPAEPINWDCPLNRGLTEMWVARPERVNQASWTPLVQPSRRAMTAITNTADTQLFSGLTPDTAAVGSWNAAGGARYRALSLASGELSPANTFSWEYVFRLRVGGAYQSLMAGGITNAAYIRIHYANQIELIKSQVAVVATSPTTLTVGQWYHLILTIDASGVWRLYLNGTLNVTSAAGNSVAATQALWINDEESSYSPSQSPVAGVAVWNGRVLPSVEVADRNDQWRRGHPDTLNRWSSRTWLPGGAGAGGSARPSLTTLGVG